MNKLTIILLFATLFFSCVDDERLINPTVEPVVKDKNVVLTMQIPGTYLPVTYAYSENDENEIRTVDVLIFRVDESGNEYYYKHIRIPTIAQNNGNTKKVQFRLEFMDSRLLVLANVRNLFTGEMEDRLRTDSVAGHVTKDEVMKRFVFDMTKPFGEEKEPFPMYGESDILRSSDTTVGEIKMTRSITRIDVVNSISDYKVRIDSIYFLQTKNKGAVAPGFNEKGEIVGTANVPSEAQPNTHAFGYKFVQNAGNVSPAMEREIYIAEDGQDTNTPTIIILKIACEDRPAQFYRVDMLNKDGELLPILRNYRYRLNILKIAGNGYPTIAAAAAVPTPSLSSTVETNELGISSVVFNDQYKLGVSTTDIVFKADGSWDGKTNNEIVYSLKVYTTYSGWSVTWEGNELAGWLNLMDVDMKKGTMDFPASRLELNMKVEPNTTGGTRQGKIKLTAGMLHLEINVVQYSAAI
ncbi:MAG: hypothetical protein LBB84_12120 [Tannerellaceae bacterium]|jgi:hypothetical protein|nr:hypothetical protein [Tannerellaceae bacterium]